MSRSYKKTPIIKSGSRGGRKFAKTQANRAARRELKKMDPDLSATFHHKGYRLFYPQWDLYDCRISGGFTHARKERRLARYMEHGWKQTYEVALKYWNKCFKWK